MGLLGNGWQDPQSQSNMALAAGLLQGNMGAGLLGASQAYGNAQNEALKRQYMQAQMGNLASEIEARKLKTIQDQRQQRMMESFFPGMFGAGQPAGDAAMVAPGQQATAMGGPPAQAPAQAPAQGGNDILALSQKLGIPPQAIQADLVFNGGKKIAEMLDKHGSRDMQVTNGYAYDRNALGAGYLPQLNTSQDGKTSMVQIGPDGLPVVSAPRGALNTYAGYQNVQEGTKANYDVMPVTPAGQPPQMTTRGALATNPQVQGRMVPPAQQAAADKERTAILQQEVTKAQAQLNDALSRGDQSAAARAQADLASLRRELGGRGATVGMPLQSPEDALRATKGVEGDAKANEARANDVKTAKKFLGIAEQAEALLKSGPTASGIGSMVDKGAALFGQTTPGAVAAQQLKSIGGWLVANVPRMEGPQSNFDVANYQVMAANVANDGLPVDQRMASLKAIKQMMENTVNGGPTGNFDKPSATPPKPEKGMIRNGYRFKGGDPASPFSWEKM